MASPNETIQPSRHTIAQIVDGSREGTYYVDDTFQRRLVWGEKQKVRLIETVLIGFPIPEIYVHQQPVDPDTGKQKFSIVDGQQRITTLTQFVSNEWPLKSRYLEKANQKAGYADKKWSDLAAPEKTRIFNYVLSFRVIPPEITTDEIRHIFRRLNETDRSLNPQEIRHAEFSGKFIKLAEKIADLPFWKKWDVFTDRNIRRMADVELSTSLLSYIKNGIVSDTTQNFNTLYDLYNDTYPGSAKDERRVRQVLTKINTLFSKSEEVADFFNKPVHLYTLFAILDQKGYIGTADQMAEKLAQFVARNSAKRKSALIQSYRKGSEQRTRSKLSREQRHEALLKFIRSK